MRLVLAAWLALALAACDSREPDTQAGPAIAPVSADIAPSTDEAQQPAVRKTRVYTVNYPLAWLTETIGGDLVEVSFPAPADIDPQYWQPGPEVIARYQAADLILLSGAGYAGWVTKASLPAGRLLDTSAPFADQLIVETDSTTHSHGPEGEHSHGVTAATVWLDPMLMTEQARVITRKLVELHPQEREALEERLVELRGRTGKWNTKLHRIVKALEGKPVLFSHPVYQYLEQRYPINGASLHWEPDSTFTDEDWAALDTLRETHPAGIMLWEDTPSPAIAAGLAERGILVAVFRPQGNRSGEHDYAAVMDANVEAFNRAAKTLLGE